MRPVVGADPEAASRLEVVMVCIVVHRSGTRIPTVWLRNPLIAARARMGLSNLMLLRSAVFRGSPAIVGWFRCSESADECCNSTGQGEGQG